MVISLVMLPAAQAACAYSANTNGGQVTIPSGTVNIADDAFNGCSTVNQIFSPPTLRSIGARAFKSSALINIFVIDNVRTIGEDAFRDTIHLTNVHFGNSYSGSLLNSIGQNAFRSSALDYAHIPNMVTVINNGVFYGTTHMTEVTFGSGSQLTTINDDAFAFSGVTAITIPPTVTSIGNSFGNSALTSFVFSPSGAATISSGAFDNTSALNCLQISSAVTYTGSKPLCTSRPSGQPTGQPTNNPTGHPTSRPPIQANEKINSSDKLPKDTVAIITVGVVLTAFVIAAVAYYKFACSAVSVVTASQTASNAVGKHSVELVPSAEEA